MSGGGGRQKFNPTELQQKSHAAPKRARLIEGHAPTRPICRQLCVCVCVLTVEGLQVDRQAAGLAVAFAAFATHVGLVARVRPHVPRQLDGLGEDGLAILAGVHFA